MTEHNIRKKSFTYILFNKPFGVVCQFSKSRGETTLANFGPFLPNVYPAGRLDADSEGLVLLTNDGALQHRLLEPKYGHRRKYLAQVEGVPGPDAICHLQKGVMIERRKTLPADVKLLPDAPLLPPRSVPIRYRKSIPTAWLELTLREGRNRQVRKMTAAVGFPTLRLVRIAIELLTIEGLQPGNYRELSASEIRRLIALVRRTRNISEEVSDGT